MNNPTNDGGPAFPVVFDHGEAVSEATGMSLRDWFAGMALTAHCSAALTADGAAAFEDVARKKSITVEQVMANASYEMANAMLKARERA